MATLKQIREEVKEKLGGQWLNKSNTKNYSLRKDDINGVEYYWPDVDRFSFPHLVKTVKPVISEVNTYVKRKGTVLQAGGNCGVYTLEYAKHYENVYTTTNRFSGNSFLVSSVFGGYTWNDSYTKSIRNHGYWEYSC